MYPDVPVKTESELIGDDSVDLVVTAAVPDRRGAIAVAALNAGKNVMTDKPGCTTFEQLDAIKQAVADSRKFWSVTLRSGSRYRRSPGQGNWSATDASARSSRPSASVRIARATVPICPAAGGVRTGSTTRRGSAASCATSRRTRSTSSSGSPDRPPPR
jgi:hypothetical protein